MRKITIIMLAFAITFSALTARAEPAIDLSDARAVMLLDADSGNVIIEKNSDQKIEVAGLKRLPALLIVCEAFDNGLISGDSIVTVPQEASKIRGATAFLSANECIKAELLLKASVMLTAGDSIYSLLLTVFPSEAAAFEKVNSRLEELGAERLPKDSMGNDTLFSLNDIFKICKALSNSPSFLKYSSVYTDSLEHENASATELVSPNRLVRFYSGCFGLATGSVGSTEYAGAFIARRGATTFLAIVAGMASSSSRFKLATDLLDYGFASFRSVAISNEGETVGKTTVKGGVEQEIEAVTGGTANALLPVSDAKVTTDAVLPEAVDAPITKGDVIGSLIIRNSDGVVIGEVPLIAKKSVEKTDFKGSFIRLVLGWLHIKKDQSISTGLISTPWNPSTL